MARHVFTFEGGEDLTTMGATWFVSYAYHKHIDPGHGNWELVETVPSRTSVFDRTGSQHRFWLERILEMDDGRLNTNEIGLRAAETKRMAAELLNCPGL